MNNFYPDRQEIFGKEVAKLFVAFNRIIGETQIQAKSALLLETLVSLPTEQIEPFFRYIRENESTLPTDGRLMSIFRLKQDVFGPNETLAITHEKAKWGYPERLRAYNVSVKHPAFAEFFRELDSDKEVYPSDELKEKFFQMMQIPANTKWAKDWTPEKEAVLVARKERV